MSKKRKIVLAGIITLLLLGLFSMICFYKNENEIVINNEKELRNYYRLETIGMAGIVQYVNCCAITDKYRPSSWNQKKEIKEVTELLDQLEDVLRMWPRLVLITKYVLYDWGAAAKSMEERRLLLEQLENSSQNSTSHKTRPTVKPWDICVYGAYMELTEELIKQLQKQQGIKVRIPPPVAWTYAYKSIGPMIIKTKDIKNYSVTVSIRIGLDAVYMSNPIVAVTEEESEFMNRQNELHDFIETFFFGKYVSELQPENENMLRKEIMEKLNTLFFDTARARIIIFDELEIIEVPQNNGTIGL